MAQHPLRGALASDQRLRGDNLALLGRFSPAKGPDQAIEIAKRAGMKLKIAAKIDKIEEGYWRKVVKSMIEKNPHIEFIGEIAERQKAVCRPASFACAAS